jgi:hypothetical protein
MKKRDLKSIKELADKLPRSQELQLCYKIIKGIKQHRYKLVDINHYDRLKKAHTKNKETGMQDYITWLKSNNEKVNKMINQ